MAASKKKPLRLMFEGNLSRNRIHYDDWRYPIPSNSDYVVATAANTLIRGSVSDVSWTVKGEKDPMGDVHVTVRVDDIMSDNNGLGPDGKPR